MDTHTGTVHFERGDAAAALQSAATVIEAEYRVPFLAHATLEPMNATVQFKDGAATVWAPTQAAGFATSAVAKALGIPAAKVDVKVTYLGGGFGRRYYTDVVVQAALLARETGGAPVQLLWPREQDMAHTPVAPCSTGEAAHAPSLGAPRRTAIASPMFLAPAARLRIPIDRTRLCRSSRSQRGIR